MEKTAGISSNCKYFKISPLYHEYNLIHVMNFSLQKSIKVATELKGLTWAFFLKFLKQGVIEIKWKRSHHHCTVIGCSAQTMQFRVKC